jgi:hypothetical protein
MCSPGLLASEDWDTMQTTMSVAVPPVYPASDSAHRNDWETMEKRRRYGKLLSDDYQ